MNEELFIKADFNDFVNIFLEENSKHNLISHNDESLLFEKHIYDSLCIKYFFDKYKINFKNILDIGCGGGFPCVPISIEYPDMQITGIDSIRKKISSVQCIKEKLDLKNLNLICDRVENLSIDIKYDLVISRAVAELAKISDYALPRVKKNGFFVAYKSIRAGEEILNSKNMLKKHGAKIVDIIEYKLPTKECHLRKLVCIKKI